MLKCKAGSKSTKKDRKIYVVNVNRNRNGTLIEPQYTTALQLSSPRPRAFALSFGDQRFGLRTCGIYDRPRTINLATLHFLGRAVGPMLTWGILAEDVNLSLIHI